MPALPSMVINLAANTEWTASDFTFPAGGCITGTHLLELPYPGQLSLLPSVGREILPRRKGGDAVRLEKGRRGSFNCWWTCGCQVKLCDRLLTFGIPERWLEISIGLSIQMSRLIYSLLTDWRQSWPISYSTVAEVVICPWTGRDVDNVISCVCDFVSVCAETVLSYQHRAPRLAEIKSVAERRWSVCRYDCLGFCFELFILHAKKLYGWYWLMNKLQY